ncbi:phage tail protein [Micromonospora soli]|uniref:phage tail protein n=1 Tax=Micromonospora sp. NBRC 110009 TaxID=3061627 RepID=UPI0026732431|nr:phage tail protein [Micromonospora sp. NBRC 110009]WKT96879.1 phage tail protein [Micromonospora sp. NBRC 110009]
MNEMLQSFKFHIFFAGSPRAAERIWRPPPDLAAKKAAAPPPPPEPDTQTGEGGFQECSGLGLETDLKEYAEGGRDDGLIRFAGRVKLQPIVLKRGMFVAGTPGGYVNTWMWDWLRSLVEGIRPVPRYSGTISVADPSGSRTLATWTFDRGLPLKVAGPQLDAKTGAIAVEELHIAHEGLRLENF